MWDNVGKFAVAGLGIAGVCAAAAIGKDAAEYAIDRYCRDGVDEPAKGSVLYCDLAFGFAEHSGIYVGNGDIVHLNGDGEIEVVDMRRFASTYSYDQEIYVSCHDYSPVGSLLVANRARAKVGARRNYSLLMDNCHQFSTGCLIGDFENASNFLWMLKWEAEKQLNANTWRIWTM